MGSEPAVTAMERMYSELADYWRLISPVHEYEEEAALYASVLRDHAADPLQTLLELGSGGGNNAFHLAALHARGFDQGTHL